MTTIEPQPLRQPAPAPRPPAGAARLLDPALEAGQALVVRLPRPVLIYVICVLLPIIFQVGSLSLSILRIFLLVVTVPLILQLFTGKFGRVLLTDILFLFHIFWAVLALAINNPDQVVQNIGAAAIEFLGGYMVGRAYIRTKADFLALCRLLVVVICVFSPFTVFETITGRPVVLEVIRALPGVKTVEFNYQEPRMHLERVQSTFAHPIHYGLFCSVAFSLAFIALKGLTTTTWRYVSCVIIALCGFLALSSGALLAIFLQISLIAWSSIFTRVKQRWWLLVGLFALAYIIIAMIATRPPMMVFFSYATFSAWTAYWRSIIFEWGMYNIWQNPIFGIGLNDWVRPYYMYSGSMDNFWLVMGVRYGIPGFLLIAMGYALGVFRVMRRDFSADARLTLIRRAWVFTFLGISFTLCTVHVWTNIYSFVFFMFGAGMWLITVKAGSDQVRQDGGQTAADLQPVGRLPPRYSRFAPRTRSPILPPH